MIVAADFRVVEGEPACDGRCSSWRSCRNLTISPRLRTLTTLPFCMTGNWCRPLSAMSAIATLASFEGIRNGVATDRSQFYKDLSAVLWREPP